MDGSRRREGNVPDLLQNFLTFSLIEGFVEKVLQFGMEP